MLQYGDVVSMDSYRSTLPRTVNPLEHLYMLERELEAAERRTTSMIEDLTRRLDQLETRVSSISQGAESASRKLELEIVALSDRLFSLEGTRAA